MSKEAEEFFRQKTIENTKRPRVKKFLALVNREAEGKILQEYADQQLLLYGVSQRSELLIRFSRYLKQRDLILVKAENLAVRVKLFLESN
jgi:hypothetical protein